MTDRFFQCPLVLQSNSSPTCCLAKKVVMMMVSEVTVASIIFYITFIVQSTLLCSNVIVHQGADWFFGDLFGSHCCYQRSCSLSFRSYQLSYSPLISLINKMFPSAEEPLTGCFILFLAPFRLNWTPGDQQFQEDSEKPAWHQQSCRSQSRRDHIFSDVWCEHYTKLSICICRIFVHSC